MEYVKYQNLPSVRFFELDKFDLLNNPAKPVAQQKATTYVGHQVHVDAINSVHSVYSPNDKEEIHFVIALSSINYHEFNAIKNKDNSISFPSSIVLDELPENHNLFLISLSTSIGPNYFYAKSKFENFLSLCLQHGIQIKVFNIKPEHLNLHPIYTTQAFFQEINRMKMLFYQFITPELKETVNHQIVKSHVGFHRANFSVCLHLIKRDFVFDENSKFGRFLTPKQLHYVSASRVGCHEYFGVTRMDLFYHTTACSNCRYYYNRPCLYKKEATTILNIDDKGKLDGNKITEYQQFWTNEFNPLGHPSYLHQLESKPSNLIQLWNNRHLESIDF